jgi:apolipoprotein N-acyltransferase
MAVSLASTPLPGGPSPGPGRRSRQALALAVLSGVLRFLAVPGYGQWYLALVFYVPLLLALGGERDRVSPGRAFRLGWVMALAGNLGGYHFLVGMLRDFSGFSLPLVLFFFVALCCYQALEYALGAWLLERARRGGVPLWVAAPAAVAGIERVFPLLFPNYLGNAFADRAWLVQVADLGGPALLTVLAMLVNVVVYQAVAAARGQGPWPRSLALATGLLLAACLGYGALRERAVARAMAAADKLRVGLVQVNMGIYEKHEEPAEGLRRHVEQSLGLEWQGPLDLLVWPESAVNFYLPTDGRNLGALVHDQDLHTPILFGGLRSADVDGRRRAYNTAFLVDRDGRLLGTYDKTYLLYFGEYLPLGETFPVLYDWSPHSGQFTPGSHVRPLELDGLRITALVCYEDVLPGFVRRAVREGRPHLLANLTNDAWFGHSVEPEVHLGLARFRAIEHRLYLVRATNTGVSAIVDPLGRVTVRGDIFTRESLAGEVGRMELGPTVFARLGDVVGWTALAVLLWAGLWRGRGRSALAATPAEPPTGAQAGTPAEGGKNG